MQNTNPNPDDWQQNVPHRRFNLLSNSWILCSPHRAKRPWLGQVEKPDLTSLPRYDPKCFLCPGNQRASTTGNPADVPPVNPNYDSTFVFTNDFSALLSEEGHHISREETKEENSLESKLCLNEEVSGVCKVICFSPRHDLTIAEMEISEIVSVVKCWKKEYEDLAQREDIKYVQIFENRGSMMGCSNPHPHCQIWASSFVPQEPGTEVGSMTRYKEKHGCCMLCDYIKFELEKKERIVCENEGFLVVVPYWALWPYEVLLLSKKHMGSLASFSEDDALHFADIIKRTTCRYDNLFASSFPYSMGLHQSPTDGLPHDEFHFHLHFYPPLLRSATIKKFMVGYEMLGEAQRDITAEQSAAKLRSLSDTEHYKSVLLKQTQ